MTQRDEQLSTRDKILKAALELFGERAGRGLSVRAVAARAGVSTGSLRHHFPTQRELQDTVLTTLYDLVMTDDRIHDTSIPARDRLVGCLRQALPPALEGSEARAGWRKVFDTLDSPGQTEAQAALLAIDNEGQRRMEYWLSVLAKEGAIPEGDLARQARFLGCVLSGLAIERAFPASETTLSTEMDVLFTAVDFILDTSARVAPPLA